MIASQTEARRPRLGPARRSRPEGGLRPVTGATYPNWDAVYRDNVTWVYRLMYSKVGNQPDAEDLAAEEFMTALKPLRVSATVPEVRKYLKMTARTYWRRTGATGWAGKSSSLMTTCPTRVRRRSCRRGA